MPNSSRNRAAGAAHTEQRRAVSIPETRPASQSGRPCRLETGRVHRFGLEYRPELKLAKIGIPLSLPPLIVTNPAELEFKVPILPLSPTLQDNVHGLSGLSLLDEHIEKLLHAEQKRNV